jgi:hypothetical protein
MSAPPAHLLVVGATGGIGRRVVAAGQRQELGVTALVVEGAQDVRHASVVDATRRLRRAMGPVGEDDGIYVLHRRSQAGCIFEVGSKPRGALMTSI